MAAQEIAASTAQLVVASRVKADRNSSNLQQLTQASKGVTTATGTVVATVKDCSELIDEAGKCTLSFKIIIGNVDVILKADSYVNIMVFVNDFLDSLLVLLIAFTILCTRAVIFLALNKASDDLGLREIIIILSKMCSAVMEPSAF